MEKRSLNKKLVSVILVTLVLVLGFGFVRTGLVNAEENDTYTTTSLQSEESTPTKAPYNSNRPITPFNCDK